jgi:hypothetical protein
VSKDVFGSLSRYTWQLTYKWARFSHPGKPVRWVTDKYYGRSRRGFRCGRTWPSPCQRTRRSSGAWPATSPKRRGAAVPPHLLHIGTGIPMAGNLHQVAQAIAPESRAVYVDYDRCKSGCVHARVRPVSRRNRLVIGWTVTGVTRRSGFPWRKAVLAPGMPMATAGEAGWLTAAPCRQRPGATVT